MPMGYALGKSTYRDNHCWRILQKNTTSGQPSAPHKTAQKVQKRMVESLCRTFQLSRGSGSVSSNSTNDISDESDVSMLLPAITKFSLQTQGVRECT